MESRPSLGSRKRVQIRGTKFQKWGKRRDRAKGVKGDIRELTFNWILGLPWGERSRPSSCEQKPN